MLRLGSAVTGVRRPVAEHVFCGISSGEGLLRAVFEDEGYSFGSPGLENGVNLGPPCGERKSTGLSRHYTLSHDVREIGTRILDGLDVPPEKRRYLWSSGLPHPPFNSANHLYLHLHALPYHGILKFEYPISNGRESKGFS